MKFLKALFEGFTAEAKKPCGKCETCTCSQPKSNFYDKYCEENPGECTATTGGGPVSQMKRS